MNNNIVAGRQVKELAKEIGGLRIACDELVKVTKARETVMMDVRSAVVERKRKLSKPRVLTERGVSILPLLDKGKYSGYAQTDLTMSQCANVNLATLPGRLWIYVSDFSKNMELALHTGGSSRIRVELEFEQDSIFHEMLRSIELGELHRSTLIKHVTWYRKPNRVRLWFSAHLKGSVVLAAVKDFVRKNADRFIAERIQGLQPYTSI